MTAVIPATIPAVIPVSMTGSITSIAPNSTVSAARGTTAHRSPTSMPTTIANKAGQAGSMSAAAARMMIFACAGHGDVRTDQIEGRIHVGVETLIDGALDQPHRQRWH